jgi:hypothetical protein
MTHLPTKRTFLVRLSDEADPEQDRYCGRVEHLQSGQTMRFQSEGTLKEFFSTVLLEQIRHEQSEQISEEP